MVQSVNILSDKEVVFLVDKKVDSKILYSILVSSGKLDVEFDNFKLLESSVQSGAQAKLYRPNYKKRH